jgi:hypothetical protein
MVRGGCFSHYASRQTVGKAKREKKKESTLCLQVRIHAVSKPRIDPRFYATKSCPKLESKTVTALTNVRSTRRE